MIISASRRTDIPAFFYEWFINRLKQGFVLVRNPMNAHQVSHIDLLPNVVDGIVFWTKNPTPMLERLDEIVEYPYYFQFTVNAYGRDVEPHVPSKNAVVIPAFQELSSKIGKERVLWRYDPVFFNEKYTADYHVACFKRLCSKLVRYTEKCTVCFVELYQKTKRNTQSLNIRVPSSDQKIELMQKFVTAAGEYGLRVDTCLDAEHYKAIGVGKAHCIDKERLERITGCRLKVSKDKNQRVDCGCAESIDIGAYHTCQNGCLYCYANHSAEAVLRCIRQYDSNAALLCGAVKEQDRIQRREMVSFKVNQLDIFNF